MSISNDEGLIDKYEQIQDALSMNVRIRHDQVNEIVVADLMAKYKACSERNDKYAESFNTVIGFYLSESEMIEMDKLIESRTK